MSAARTSPDVVLLKRESGELNSVVAESVTNVAEMANDKGETSSHNPSVEPFNWTFYYDEGQRASKQHTTGNNSRAHMVKLGTFMSVEAFWSYCQTLDKSLDRICKGGKFNLRLFKGGIQPYWQDAANIHGGKWVLSCNDGIDNTRVMWNELVIAAITARLPQYQRLCGVALAQRESQRELQIWVDSDPFTSSDAPSLDLEASQKAVTALMRAALRLSESAEIRYYSHESLMSRRLDLKRDNQRIVKVSHKQAKAQTWPEAPEQGESKMAGMSRDVESLNVKLNIGSTGLEAQSEASPMTVVVTPPSTLPAASTSSSPSLAPALMEEEIDHSDGQSLSVTDAPVGYPSPATSSPEKQSQAEVPLAELRAMHLNGDIKSRPRSDSQSSAESNESSDSELHSGLASNSARQYLAAQGHPSPGALVKALLATVGDGSPAALAAAAAALIPDNIPRALARSMRKKARRKLNRLKRKRLVQLQQMAKDGLIPHSAIPTTLQAVSLTRPVLPSQPSPSQRPTLPQQPFYSSSATYLSSASSGVTSESATNATSPSTSVPSPSPLLVAAGVPSPVSAEYGATAMAYPTTTVNINGVLYPAYPAPALSYVAQPQAQPQPQVVQGSTTEYMVIPEQQFMYDGYGYDLYGYQYVFDPFTQQMVYLAPVQPLPQPLATSAQPYSAGSRSAGIVQSSAPAVRYGGANTVYPTANGAVVYATAAVNAAPVMVAAHRSTASMVHPEPVIPQYGRPVPAAGLEFAHTHNRHLLSVARKVDSYASQPGLPVAAAAPTSGGRKAEKGRQHDAAQELQTGCHIPHPDMPQ